jgi:hypothetical protein
MQTLLIAKLEEKFTQVTASPAGKPFSPSIKPTRRSQNSKPGYAEAEKSY